MTVANWTTRRIEQHVAAGILIADLGILEAHWLPASLRRVVV